MSTNQIVSVRTTNSTLHPWDITNLYNRTTISKFSWTSDTGFQLCTYSCVCRDPCVSFSPLDLRKRGGPIQAGTPSCKKHSKNSSIVDLPHSYKKYTGPHSHRFLWHWVGWQLKMSSIKCLQISLTPSWLTTENELNRTYTDFFDTELVDDWKWAQWNVWTHHIGQQACV
jgi:hypothetical protein